MSELENGSRPLKRYVAEFFVIFLGVWLSLLAEQWRQGREDLGAERLALEGMVQDLGLDLLDLTSNVNRARPALESASWLGERRRVRGVSDDSVAAALTELGPCSFPQWNTSQYSTLKSSGGLNLIRTPGLRTQISEYYETRAGLELLHEADCAESSGVYELLAPFVTLGVPVGDPVAGRTREFSAVVTQVASADAILSDAEIIDRVVKLASHRTFLVYWIEQEIEKAEALRGAIEEELGGG
jgi:hypothetical protein